MPYYNTISISGYHIREAGSTAAQELAFTLADGFTYLDYGIKAGLMLMSLLLDYHFFLIHLDFFEEIANLERQDVSGQKRLKLKYKAK